MNSAPPQAFKYPECKKGEFHVGEALSLVCIEPKCIQKCVICGICYNEDHSGHKIKPLKMIINNAKKYLNQMTPVNIDAKSLQESVKESQKNILSKYQEFQEYVFKVIKDVRDSLDAVFIKILEQIDLKTGSNEELLKALEQISDQEMETQRFISLMKKILAGVPIEVEEEEQEISGKQIQASIDGITKKMQKDLESKSETVKKQLESFVKSLQKTMDSPSIFDTTIEFKYSNELKHQGVEVISETVVKSIEAYNYHFCLMEPSLQEKGNRARSVAYKIKENTSNWLGMGVCHKNIVQSNNYQFNYSTLGHGGYMISSNGGSWSSIDSTKNNVVTSFSFAKGDIIIVSYEPDEKRVVFTKKGTNETHTIELDVKDDDEFYLCNLFYYSNDQIEYLGPSDSLE